MNGDSSLNGPVEELIAGRPVSLRPEFMKLSGENGDVIRVIQVPQNFHLPEKI